MTLQGKVQVIESVRQALVRSDQSTREVLTALDVAPASFYRWLGASTEPEPRERTVRPPAAPPTPAEEEAVRRYALQYPGLGYKRLAWQMLDQNVAALKPYQVYRILGDLDLIARRPREPQDPLRRPEPPKRADEVWHIDLMYVSLSGRWYYLVDIVDGYSRYLVHWSLNATMLAQTVTMTVQEALDRLDPRTAEQPRIIHDHGAQFVSAEWRSLIQSTGMVDIRTRVAHPQSNGVVERLHRTHREESSLDADVGYHEALDRFATWSSYYNCERPHSALNHLCPFDYYRGDPAARLLERSLKLAAARESRADYWSRPDNHHADA